MVTFDDAWWEPIPEPDKQRLLNARHDRQPNPGAIDVLRRHGVLPTAVGWSGQAAAGIEWPDGLRAFLEREELRRRPQPDGVAADVPSDLGLPSDPR
jgi:hypothetical protein